MVEKECLKGLSHEIFGLVLPVWMRLGLNRKRFWFLSFKEALSILDRHFKFSCVSCQTLATESAVLRLFKLEASLRHANVVEEYSWRTEDSVANPSL